MTDGRGMCRAVDERLGALVDGVADDEVLDHLASCERCRDVRYEAEQLSLLVADAAGDYRWPEELGERLMRAVDAAPAPSQRLPSARLGFERLARSLRPHARGTPAPGSRPAAPPPAAARAIEPARRAAATARPSARWAWLSLAGAVGLGLLWLASRGEPGALAPSAPSDARAGAWQGQVASVERALGSPTGLMQCARGTQVCQAIGPGGVAHAGVRLETDGSTRARIQLADGSTLALDRLTRFELDPSQRRRGRLLAGSVVAEIEPDPRAGADSPGAAPATGAERDVHAIIDVPFGRAEVLGTKFSLRAGEDGTHVEVSRGSVKLVEGEAGRSALVKAGEAALLTAGAAPQVAPASDLAGALEWSTSAFEPPAEPAQGALGSLLARRPGADRELSDVVRLVRHDVRVRIVDSVARTEVEELFENLSDEVLEGTYSFPLPPGAQLERLALELNGRLEEGAFVERQSGAAIAAGGQPDAAGGQPAPGDDGAWAPGPWRDPAVLEWQRGNRFELRVSPIPKRGTRRVVLAYTELLPPSEGQRRYVYPLPSDPRGSAPIARFSVEVQVRGHDRARPVAASGYALANLSDSPELARLGFEEPSFVPHGDLTVAYSLAHDGELRALAYQPGSAPAAARTAAGVEREGKLPADAPYVALVLGPTLPRRTRYEALDYVLVADTSRSMFGESYRRATRVITRLVAELDRSAQVTVLGCDSTCQALPGGFLAPGAAAAEAAQRFLESIEPDGASDLALAVERATSLRERRRDTTQPPRGLRVIYVGDGTPTVGPIHPALLEPAVAEHLPDGASLNAVAIGSDAARGALRVATRAGGGTTVPFAPGMSVDDVVYAVLGSSYGQPLMDARLDLPEGLVQVLPKKLGSVAAGTEQLVVARMTRPRVEGSVVLRGQLAGEPFERRYALKLAAQPGEAHAFVPRLYASVAIAELEASLDESARRRSVELSTELGVASRYTWLQVLDSPALFGAVGLSNRHAAPAPAGGQAASRERGAAEPGATPGGTTAPLEPPAEPEQRLASMRRVWERVGKIEVPPVPFASASVERRSELARLAEERPESRSALHELYVASLLAGDLEAAGQAAERWAARAPLDVQALTARADVAAQRGDRERSIRVLGSVVDVSPTDPAAQWRLARLHRWAGQPARGCRHALAAAQLWIEDAQLVSDGIGCVRDAGDDRSADMLLAALPASVRAEVERLSRKRRSSDELSGDFRVLGSWQGAEHDLDLVILHPDGHRVSWLGAPNGSLVTARDVLGTEREGLALRGALSGQYAVELVRASPRQGPVRGSVRIQAAGSVRSVPFVLEGERTRVATVSLRSEARLVPLERGQDPRWE